MKQRLHTILPAIFLLFNATPASCISSQENQDHNANVQQVFKHAAVLNDKHSEEEEKVKAIILLIRLGVYSELGEGTPPEDIESQLSFK